MKGVGEALIIRGGDVYLYAILTFLGVLFVLWGIKIARVLSSITLGLVLAYLFYLYTFTISSSVFLSILASLVGLFIGVLLGFLLLRVALSILGSIYITDLFIKYLHIGEVSSLLYFILFIIFALLIFLISSYVIAIVFVALGALMLWIGLIGLGLPDIGVLIIVVTLSAIGLVNQFKSKL